MATRTLSPGEERWLSEAQKDYLRANPLVVCLQPQMLACEALYNSPRHGAVTIDRAMELDALRQRAAAVRAAGKDRSATTPVVELYSAEEDDFIDRHGMSSRLC